MSKSQKRPYDVTLNAALTVMELLRPACEKLEIAGSLRRECAEVGDIELVAIPRYTTNLLGEPDGLELDGRLAGLPNVLLSKDGPKYKQFEIMLMGQSYQVDLFLADADNWGYILMLRIGPSDFSKSMVTPVPYGLKPPQIRVADGYVYTYPGNQRLSIPDEAVLFATWHMEYLSPKERR